MLAMIIEEKRFRTSFALIVARSHTYGIDIAPVTFDLWVNGRIAIDFRCRSLEDLGFDSFGQAEHIDSAVYGSFRRLDRIKLIMDRRCRTGKVINLIDFYIKGETDVVVPSSVISFYEVGTLFLRNVATRAGHFLRLLPKVEANTKIPESSDGTPFPVLVDSPTYSLSFHLLWIVFVYDPFACDINVHTVGSQGFPKLTRNRFVSTPGGLKKIQICQEADSRNMDCLSQSPWSGSASWSHRSTNSRKSVESISDPNFFCVGLQIGKANPALILSGSCTCPAQACAREN